MAMPQIYKNQWYLMWGIIGSFVVLLACITLENIGRRMSCEDLEKKFEEPRYTITPTYDYIQRNEIMSSAFKGYKTYGK